LTTPIYLNAKSNAKGEPTDKTKTFQAMLYYWLKASTVTASVDERFCQKLERHWPAVAKRIGQMKS
jgi:hypothetical protein